MARLELTSSVYSEYTTRLPGCFCVAVENNWLPIVRREAEKNETKMTDDLKSEAPEAVTINLYNGGTTVMHKNSIAG